MKCDDCLNLLEAYVDGEASERETEQVRAHLLTCAGCTSEFEALTAENDIYARYDRGLEISPSLWNGIAAQIVSEERQSSAKSKFDLREWLAGLFAVPSFRFAMPAVALVLIAVIVGLAYWRTRPQPQPPGLRAGVENPAPLPTVDIRSSVESPSPSVSEGPEYKRRQPRVVVATATQPTIIQPDSGSDVLFKEDIEDRDTASHLEQAQNLLLSFRNIKYSDTDEEVDVSYEKTESRRLLSENVVLRRDAEMAGKFPAKTMLGSLEPFLIDIANLPDKAKPNDVRQITDRVQRTEIVAELRGY